LYKTFAKKRVKLPKKHKTFSEKHKTFAIKRQNIPQTPCYDWKKILLLLCIKSFVKRIFTAIFGYFLGKSCTKKQNIQNILPQNGENPVQH
jgi:hypothetical protein